MSERDRQMSGRAGTPDRWLTPGVAVLLCAAVFAACERPSDRGTGESTQRPDVILISVDSLRADHLGTYGYARATSPHLDALASDGIVFERAYSTTSWTLPAHLSLLTSLYPEIHGVTDGPMRLDEKAVLLSEILQDRGYRTLGVVSAPFLESKFGYDQGFDLYDDRTVSFRTHKDSHLGITSPRLHERIIEVLETETNPDEPFLAFLHYWDAHYDYQPPEPFDARFRDPGNRTSDEGRVTAADLTREYGMDLGNDPAVLEEFIALYDGEIAFVDSYLGKLFDHLRERGRYRDALIIVTSDHGQEFLEHDLLFHRWNLYDTALRIPLIVKLPGNRWAGARVDTNVGIVDIMPTVLDVLGLPLPAHLNGRSLVPLITDDSGADAVYFAELAGKVRSVRRGRWKLIATDGENGETIELFDTETDPDEQRNLFGSEPTRARTLRSLHREWLELAGAQGQRLDAVEFEYDEALESALRSLGYVD